MTTCSHTQMSAFSIREPRYHDKMVLLAAHKVATHNKVTFTNAPSMGTDPYYVSGGTVKKYHKTTNGTIKVYAVPIDELQPLEYKQGCIHDL